ncbi:NTP transferase domain-containing protein [Desulfovibrio subterraneus]|uniref:NTP transferase domain-containing protein n=1 Tax=Desulfovibrio subterraneus TaxID=2718620 RepID=UPI00157AA7F3|nr:NTP transferase domain-containing protein [Desulfovibrio subterraneus]
MFSEPPVPAELLEQCRIGGIILAAGEASRMGRCKAVLPLGDCAEPTVLQAALQALQGGCNGPVVVVTGFHEAAVRAEAVRLGLPVVHNPDAASGMFSSVCVGIRALTQHGDQLPYSCGAADSGASGDSGHDFLPDFSLDALFVLPVDIPLVRPETCALLTESFAARHDAVTYPTFDGERGHPPLLRRDVAEAALRHTGEGGLRAVLEQVAVQGETECDVPVVDAGILADMDTPDAYGAVRERYSSRNVPSEAETAVLLDLAQTLPHTRAHGKAVADAALCMAEALHTVRGDVPAAIDLPLVYAAALLHDICKGAKHHERAGGLFLARYGFAEAGRIVAAHRDIDPAFVERVGERELVMLADKFVRGTRLVPIAERYDERLREWAHDAQAVADIGGRKERALALLALLERELGTDVHALLQRSGIWKTA